MSSLTRISLCECFAAYRYPHLPALLKDSVLPADPEHHTLCLHSEKDWRLSMIPRFHEDAIDANVRLLEEMQALADRKGCTPGQLALAWVRTLGTCLPGCHGNEAQGNNPCAEI